MGYQASKFERALQLHQSGNPKEAIDLYKKILRKEKNNAHLLFLLGTALYQTGSFKDGISYLKRSSDLFPTASTYNNLGTAYSLLHKTIEAMDCYEKAITLDPKYAEAYCNLAGTLRNLGRSEESLAELTKAIELEPNYPIALYSKGAILRSGRGCLNRFS